MIRPWIVNRVVLAASTLHNIMIKDFRLLADREGPQTHKINLGEWRQDTNNLDDVQKRGRKLPCVAKDPWAYLAEYYTRVGAVPWQIKRLNQMVGPLTRN